MFIAKIKSYTCKGSAIVKEIIALNVLFRKVLSSEKVELSLILDSQQFSRYCKVSEQRVLL